MDATKGGLRGEPAFASGIGPVELGADRADRIRHVRRVHDRYLQCGQVPASVAEVVANSWRRSRRAGVNVELDEAPVQLVDDELRCYREGHPLAPPLSMFRALPAGGRPADGDQ